MDVHIIASALVIRFIICSIYIYKLVESISIHRRGLSTAELNNNVLLQCYIVIN